ncbi:acyl-CoA desaturase [Parasphingorhabdus sp.]|uniref:acyl-CoA desaturase n=1 Tax=Parasphingorhabdus sp. TaxID=2709688 RepID=UPI0032659CA6
MATAFNDIQPDNFEPAVDHPQHGVIIGGPAARAKKMEYGILLASMVLGSLGALYWTLTQATGWVEWSAFLSGYVIINMGVGIGYHRFYTHRAFETSKPMRYAIAIMAQLACQASVLKWAADHRRHHAFADKVGDLHSPHVDGFGKPMKGFKGFAIAHFGWLFDDTTSDMNVYGKGLIDDDAVMFAHRTRWLWVLVSMIGIPVIWALSFGTVENIIGTVLIGGFFRTFFFLNLVMGVNSIGHMFGTQRFKTGDRGRNNWWLALLTFGDGWHNNHHRHPRSAYAGMMWWEIDVNGYIISLWEKMGLVWNVQHAPKYVRTEQGEWIQERKSATSSEMASPEAMSRSESGILFPEKTENTTTKEPVS